MSSITIGDRISGPFYNGISAICPHCETIVGVCIDPDDIASDVMRGLNKTKSSQNFC
jgi:hypothetical protein